MRLNYGRTLLLGLAFCGVQVLFAIYNAYMPIILQSGRPDFAAPAAIPGGFGLDAGLTGLIMSLENMAALLILPFIGALSDATASRLGKRKPYLLIGAPITAAAFAGLPLMLGQPLWLFLPVAFVFIIAVDVIRTPIAALMPDITPSHLRSQANGLINVMGGLGGVLAFVVGGALFRESVAAPFAFGAAALVIGCLVVVALVPVPSSLDLPRPQGGLAAHARAALSTESGVIGELRVLAAGRDRSPLLLLGAIFFVFVAYGALTVFFTSFATDTLQVPRGTEAQLLTWFALTFLVAALPAGLLSGRLGRRRVSVAGTLVLLTACVVIGLSSDLWLIRGMLVVAGIGWALVGINALPMVLDCNPAGAGRIGVYAGIYYLATQAADVFGPTIIGMLIDLSGRNYRTLFIYIVVALTASALLMLRVRRGEALPAVPASA
ncbi:MAG: SLC45 family MFS transporter [Roseiflexaceae bacterium]